MLVSAVYHHESAIGIYMSLFSWTSLHLPLHFHFHLCLIFIFLCFSFFPPFSFFPSLFFSFSLLAARRQSHSYDSFPADRICWCCFVRGIEKHRSADSHSPAPRLSWPDSPQWNEGQHFHGFPRSSCPGNTEFIPTQWGKNERSQQLPTGDLYLDSLPKLPPLSIWLCSKLDKAGAEDSPGPELPVQVECIKAPKPPCSLGDGLTLDPGSRWPSVFAQLPHSAPRGGVMLLFQLIERDTSRKPKFKSRPPLKRQRRVVQKCLLSSDRPEQEEREHKFQESEIRYNIKAFESKVTLKKRNSTLPEWKQPYPRTVSLNKLIFLPFFFFNTELLYLFRDTYKPGIFGRKNTQRQILNLFKVLEKNKLLVVSWEE